MLDGRIYDEMPRQCDIEAVPESSSLSARRANPSRLGKVMVTP